VELDVSELKNTMSRQKGLIEELCALANKQLQALKQDDLDELRNIISHQEYIGRQLAVLEQKRMMILEQYSQDVGIEIKHFSELQRYTNSDDFETLQIIRDEIIDRSQKLKKDNELNSLLLKQGLDYTGKMLSVLNGKRSFVYGKLGNVQQKSSKSILDTNV
jgi:flagellar biosynthesis/type III secretory pathway chaperone